ncbi:hypothetical protein BU14_0159s0040 [Porphyra umbilicalis]|uniref:PDZ domain-containing protein n=1 Tax=Porphyra umbilicalis TaxID=2786 RepID=A0A1X6P8Y2_PORUM|nr:hypothetical protein BU14_0159s0040 [Porphyra umbilicalis]|eukprot:OSX77185.1 hypothetical protein BU14_0159s0040 [Porphyra umbilicalis]
MTRPTAGAGPPAPGGGRPPRRCAAACALFAPPPSLPTRGARRPDRRSARGRAAAPPRRGAAARRWGGGSPLRSPPPPPRWSPPPSQPPPAAAASALVAALPALVGAAASAVAAAATAAASTLTGVALLGVVIVVHEGGHYLAARAQGIRVAAFSVGFGPKLASWTPRGGGRSLPSARCPSAAMWRFPTLGGGGGGGRGAARRRCTRPGGRRRGRGGHGRVGGGGGGGGRRRRRGWGRGRGPPAARTPPPPPQPPIAADDPDLLQNRPVAHRALVLSAGVVANVVLAYGAVVASVLGAGVPVTHPLPGVVVSALVDDRCAGAAAGVRPGDVIVAVDGVGVAAGLDSAAVLAAAIRGGRGAPLTLDLLRRAPPPAASAARAASGQAALGVRLSPNAVVRRVRPPGGRAGIGAAHAEFRRLAAQTAGGLIPRRRSWSPAAYAGPVALVSMGADLARTDAAALLAFGAVISLHLAMLNALPLPALDGGQLAFLAIEAVRGRPVDRRVQEGVNRTALLLLLLLSTVVLVGDVAKLRPAAALRRLVR